MQDSFNSPSGDQTALTGESLKALINDKQILKSDDLMPPSERLERAAQRVNVALQVGKIRVNQAEWLEQYR